MGKWLIIDGYHLLFRNFYAIPPLKRSDGFPTNALHGWARSIWKLSDDEKPDEILAVFDLGEDRERLELFPEYKADRPSMPEELRQQVPVVKKMTRMLGVDMVEIEEVEADDIIGGYARMLAEDGHEVFIVSGDKDFAQCVGDGISLLIPPHSASSKAGWQRLDPAGVLEKFGVRPDQIPDYLALIGDTIDGIPGIPGVGPKTAERWLSQYGSIEGILENVDQLKPLRFREIVLAEQENLKRNLQLTTFKDSIDLPPFEKLDPDPEGLCALFEELEMKNHLKEAKRRYPGPDLFTLAETE